MCKILFSPNPVRLGGGEKSTRVIYETRSASRLEYGQAVMLCSTKYKRTSIIFCKASICTDLATSMTGSGVNDCVNNTYPRYNFVSKF